MKTISKRIISSLIAIAILVNVLPNFGMLTNISYATHTASAVSTPENAKALVYIDDTFEDNGFFFDEYCTFAGADGSNGFKVDIYFQNVTATTITIPIRYDTSLIVPVSPYYLVSGRPPRQTITFAGFTEEAYGLNSSEFLQDDGQLADVSASFSGNGSNINTTTGLVELEFGKEDGTTFTVTDQSLVCSIYFLVKNSVASVNALTEQMISLDMTRVETYTLGSGSDYEGFYMSTMTPAGQTKQDIDWSQVVYTMPQRRNYSAGVTSEVEVIDKPDDLEDAALTIVYYTKVNNARGTQVSAPENAGEYYVSLVIDNSSVYNSATLDLETVNASNTIIIDKATPAVTNPLVVTTTYDEEATLADVSLPSGYTWEVSTSLEVGDVNTTGKTQISGTNLTALFTPNDQNNFNTVPAIPVKLIVNPAEYPEEVEDPDEINAYIGQTLADVEDQLPAGFEFVDAGTTSVTAGTSVGQNRYRFNVVYDSGDSNYLPVNKTVVINVSTEIPKVDPEYTSPIAMTANYGQTLNDIKSQFPTPSNGTYTFNDSLSTSVGNAGVHTFYATFTPNDTTTYNTITNVEVNVTVSQVAPTYETPIAMTATYNQTLNDIVSQFPASSTGVYTFNDAGSTKVGNVGTNTFYATFTPNDRTNYSIVSNIEVNVTVSKATPNVRKTLNFTANYGQTLNDIKSKIPSTTGGTYTFNDPLTTSVGPVGTNTFYGTYTPNNTTNFETLTDIEMVVTVSSATPTYIVPTGANYISAEYGSTLQSVLENQIADLTARNNAKAGNTKGTYTFDAGTDLTTKLTPASLDNAVTSYTLTFTPDDANYQTVTGIGLHIQVTKATPTCPEINITVPLDTSLDEIEADTTSNGLAYSGYKPTGIPGNYNFVYDITNDTAITRTNVYSTYPQPAGSTVQYRARYYVSGSSANYYNDGFAIVNVTVTKGTPNYTKPTNLTATYGQTLADVSLANHNSTYGIYGTYQWEDGTRSVGNVGTRTHTMVYVPNDSANYNNATFTVQVTVNKAPLEINKITGLTGIAYQNLSKISLADIAKPTGVNGETVPGSYSWIYPTTSLGTESDTPKEFDVRFTPSDSNYQTTDLKAEVTVIAVAVDSLEITDAPTKTNYVAGQSFNSAGMVVKAHYNNGTSEIITNYTIVDGARALTTSDTAMVVSYEGKTVSQPITVVAKAVDSIAITTEATKTNYVEGQVFDRAGMVVTAYYNDETSAVITDYVIVNETRQLTPSDTAMVVTYSGKTANQSITVAAKAVDSIEVTTAPTKTEYVEGQSFARAGMVVTAHYNDGTSAPVTTYTIVNEGRALTTSDTSMTINYNGKSTTQPITVIAKVVDSIEVTTAPTKVNYIAGQSFARAGMVVTAHYNDGTSAPVTNYTITDENRALATTDTEMVINYNGKTTTQAITVIAKTIESIAVTTPATKTEYVEGQSFARAGMVVTAYYNDESSTVITNYTITDENRALTTSDTAMVVNFQGKTASQPITVVAKAVTSIAVTTQATKTEYVAGQTFDRAGMVVTAYYNDNTSAVVTDYTITNENRALTTSDTAMVVNYSGKTASQPITVVAKAVDSIAVTTPATKTEYVEGQSFARAGMVVTAYYNDGTNAPITDYTITNENRALTTSDTAMTINYQGKTTTQAITVIAKVVDSIAITTPATKTEYVEGQKFNRAGMVVTAYYNDGTSGTITSYTITDENRNLTTNDTAMVVNYNGKTASQAITVVAKAVTSIAVTTPATKTQYVEGQKFNRAGMVVTAYYNDGTSAVVTDYTITNETRDLTTSDTAMVVNYSGKTASQPITVVAKAVTSIAITTPATKTEYVEGQKFDRTGMVVTAYYNDETNAVVTDYTITDETRDLTINDTAMVVNYSGKTASQPITVAEKVIDSIRIKTPPTKVEYIEGQNFNPAGMVIEVNFNDGSKSEVAGTASGVTFDKTTLTTADTSVTVTYRGKTASQEITVIADSIVDFTLTAPTKLEYNYGESINLAGATITKQWASGIAHANDTIAMTVDMLSSSTLTNFNALNALGNNQVNVTFNGITKNNAFQVRVNDYVTGIEIEEPEKLQTQYAYGDTINVKGPQNETLNVVINYRSGNTDTTPLTTNMVSGFSMTTLGDQTVTVTYQGKTTQYGITVVDEVIGIRIITEPTKKVYTINDTLDTTGLVVKNIMKSGAQGSALTAEEYEISGFTSATAGDKVVTVTKVDTNLSDTFIVKVIDATEEIVVSQLPKTEYTYGEALSLANGKVKVVSQSDETEIDMTDASITVTGFNSNTLGQQTLTVTYTYQEENGQGTVVEKTKSTTYTVNVEDAESGNIRITSNPNKLTYKYGEDIDLEGGKVAKVMLSGAIKDEVQISGEMISGYNANEAGTQTITVSYADKTATFTVTVVDEVEGISIKTLPDKLEYTRGQALDLTGGVINATKTSGIKEIPMAMWMISGYNANVTGSQLLTVNIDGKTATFTVTVKEPERPVTPVQEVKEEKITVTFEDYDGTILDTVTVTKGEPIIAPEIGKRKGYKFVKWSKDLNFITSNTTVTAIYEEIPTALIEPDKLESTVGEKLNLGKLTLVLFDDYGEESDRVEITEDMISGFDPDVVGIQTVTVNYVDEDGREYSATFNAKVIRKVETLAEKSTNEEKDNTGLILAVVTGVGLTAALVLLFAALKRKNVEIYAIKESEKTLIGTEKISKNSTRIDLNKYEEELKDAESIEISIDKKTAKSFDSQEVEVAYKGLKSTYTVKGNGDENFVITKKN